MKNNLFFALAVAGALASCSNDEVLNNVENMQSEPQAIGFNGFVNKSTRATMDLAQIKTTGFSVWGGFINSSDEIGSVFSAQDVTWASTEWTYTPLRYWTPGNDYSFTAVAPKGNTAWSYTHTTPALATDFTAKRHGVITFTQPTDATKGNVDLVLASATVTNAKANQAPVELTFNHLLSRVRFKFTNGFAIDKSYITVENLQFTTDGAAKIDLTGYATDAAVKTMAWTNKSGSCTTSHLFGTASASEKFNNGENVTSTEAFVIPTKDVVTISFTARLFTLNADNTTYTEQSPSAGWAHTVTLDLQDIGSTEVMVPGYSYTFVAELNEDNIADESLTPIKFTATVADWTDYVELPYLIFNKSTVNLTVGSAFTLLHGVDGLTVTYKSVDPAIATVDTDGKVTGVAVGTTKIKAIAPGYQETIVDVEVTAAP